MDTRTTIGRLRVRAALDPLAARPGVERALHGADPRPSGLGPAAILVVRSMPDPLPGGLDPHAAVPASGARWSGALRVALERRLAAAARPALAPPAADATAVLFADRAELLACLVRDRDAGDLWWWRALRRTGGAGAGGPVVRALLAWPQDVPAAVARLAAWGLAERFASELEPADAVLVRRAVADAFGVAADPPGAARAVGPAPAATPGPGRPRGDAAVSLQAVGQADPGPNATAPTAAGPTAAGPADPTVTAPAPTAPTLAATAGAAPPRPDAGAPGDRSDTGGRGPGARAAGPVPGVRGRARDADPPGAVDRPPGDRPVEDSSRPASAAPLPAAPLPAAPLPSAPPAPALPAPAPPAPAPTPTAVAESATEPRALLDLCRALRPAVPDEVGGERPVRTELGGLLHLVHVAQVLGLYAGAADPHRPNLRLPVWDLVALLGAALLPRRWRRDPVWALLAALSGRPLDRPPGIRFRPPRGRAWAARGRPPAGSTGRDRWVAGLADHVRDRLALATGLPRHRAPALVLVRPALVHVTATDVDVVSALADLPIEVRLAGLDRDPGFVPAAGRRLRFHFR